MKNCVIVGAGGFGREVKMLIDQINAESKQYNLLGFYDDMTPKGTLINGLEVLGTVEDLNRVSEPTAVSIAIGAPKIKKNIVGIAGIDTRSLTRHLREHGAQSGCIFAEKDIDEARALKFAQEFSGLLGLDLAQKVTTQTSYNFNEGEWSLGNGFEKKNNKNLNVVAYDFGIKKNILRMLVSRGCKVTVVPAKTDFDDVIALEPDGIFLSNGPGDPEPCEYAINNIKVFLKKEIPTFGICLGHQLLALASGAKTEKMKFGHHGANHPVRDLESGKVFITSQNHGFSVDPKSLSRNLKITHLSLFDQSIQGIERSDVPAFGFQGHPEASPGPTEMSYLFDKFIAMIKTARTKNE